MVTRALTGALLLIHAGLLAWGVVGLAEWALPAEPWPPISNPAFPRWVLLLHWLAILAGGGTFVAGYALRWRHLPQGMAAAYGFMAAVCALETLGYMTGAGKWAAMAAEYTAYLVILALLYRAPGLRARFAG